MAFRNMRTIGKVPDAKLLAERLLCAVRGETGIAIRGREAEERRIIEISRTGDPSLLLKTFAELLISIAMESSPARLSDAAGSIPKPFPEATDADMMRIAAGKVTTRQLKHLQRGDISLLSGSPFISEVERAFYSVPDRSVRGQIARTAESAIVHGEILSQETAVYSEALASEMRLRQEIEEGRKAGGGELRGHISTREDAELVLANLALNRHLESKLRLAMTGTSYPTGVRWALAGHEDEAVQLALLSDPEFSVRLRLAAETRCLGTQRRIALGDDHTLAMVLAGSRHLHPSLFALMLAHPNLHVSRTAHGNVAAMTSNGSAITGGEMVHGLPTDRRR